MNDTSSPLADSYLDMNSMIERKETLWTIFTWTIMNYSELTEEIAYYRNENVLENRLQIVLKKNKNTLLLSVKSQDPTVSASFSITGKNDQVLNDVKDCVVHMGLSVSLFCNEVLLDPNNGYLNDDTLVVQCKYRHQPNDDSIHVIPWDEYRERRDLVHLQNDWREMFLHSRFCDFKIIVQGKSFYTHKVILGARSGYFAYRFAEVERYAEDIASINGPSYIFHEVLMFMYTGELVEMNLTSMLDVFELAHLLSINSLMEKCICMFRERMKEETIIYVFAKAKALEYDPLVFECFDFMEKHCPHKLTLYEEMKNIGLEHLAMMKIVK